MGQGEKVVRGRTAEAPVFFQVAEFEGGDAPVGGDLLAQREFQERVACEHDLGGLGGEVGQAYLAGVELSLSVRRQGRGQEEKGQKKMGQSPFHTSKFT